MKKRLLIFVVAYNAETTLGNVLARIPHGLLQEFELEVLAIDDASSDETFSIANTLSFSGSLPFSLKVLVNPINQGYGGNQKLGYQYALRHGFDFVALLHGDGQYAPEALPKLLDQLIQGGEDAVFGSRMLTPGAARQGGMPLYKFIGNKILTAIENALLGTSLSEFHSGYRVYSVSALRKIPFERNTNDFHFDTEIIVQLIFAGLKIAEVPIPTYYGNEICHVNGLRYAKDVVVTVLRARAQAWSILYDPKFDCVPLRDNQHYTLKLGYPSTHQAVLDLVPPGSKVLDIGCAGGGLGALLRQRSMCQVFGVDEFPLMPGVALDQFTLHDLNRAPLPQMAKDSFDYVLLMDVIEHLSDPETFVSELRAAMSRWPGTRLVISTANVAFLPVRLMLMVGQFNYGKRGILDLTHRRLFTFGSLRRLLRQGGFEILETRGIGAPFPLALGGGWLARTLVAINGFLTGVSRSIFSYQMLLVARPTPLVDQLLEDAHLASHERSPQANVT
jgi:glycosyltransferase involved in cell wall biosynthesis